MKNQNQITAGSIVKSSIATGYYRVTSVRAGKVNLGSIFGKKIYHKGSPIENVTECEKEWYSKWQQSESYMSM